MAIASVEQAQQLLSEYQGLAENFQLVVPLAGLTLHSQPVPLALAMAVITDRVLDKGWLPDGFIDVDGMRHYRYSQ